MLLANTQLNSSTNMIGCNSSKIITVGTRAICNRLRQTATVLSETR